MFEISYKKNNNKKLFNNLEEEGLSNVQNYIPIYNRFLLLNENNYNSVNLNHKYNISNIKSKITNNVFKVHLKDEDNNEYVKESFFKFSPLLDPIKYMVGKYKKLDLDKIKELPKLKDAKCSKKVLDTNNSAYTDAFFSYLSSILLNHYKFPHGLNYYGSFLGIQKEHTINIIDDLEYLYNSDYFHKHLNTLYETEDIDEELLEDDTRTHRKKLSFKTDVGDDMDIKCETINNDMFKDIFDLTHENVEKHNKKNGLTLEMEMENKNNSKKTNSTCSSRSSNTDNEDEEDEDGEDKDGEDKDGEEGDDRSEDESEDESEDDDLESCSNSGLSDYSSFNNELDCVKAKIYNFPVNMICLEKMENTLDSLMEVEKEEDELTMDEWRSCLFQIIMTLVVYQKVFKFTHNDLHTNNIMYELTDKKFICYKYNNVYYKVPTYGKIYKIIDFGRSIYNHSNKVFCSDSFHSKGDANSQYNFEPYFNDKKPRLEPNFSFDLCRLGCSIFDYFFDDPIDVEEEDEDIPLLIAEWCLDDRKKNILYKTNGEERYPDFKLYKMIVRNVHNHVPEKQLDNIAFKRFVVGKKKVKKMKIFDIDKMPVYH